VRRAATALWIGGAVIVVGAMALVGLLVEERSFSVDAIEVEAWVLSDGSMLVHEQVTYSFRGADSQPFTVASRDFEPGGFAWRIAWIAAFEDGEPLRTVWWTPQLFEWDIAPAHSGTRTFQLAYRVEGAVQVWTDTAELYWNWIGTTSPEVGSWAATVWLPRVQADGEVRAWAHGPLDGQITVRPDQILSTVDEVPAGQHVDNRILMPTEWFDVGPIPLERLDQILAEEQRWAEDANRQRADAERRESRRRTAATALAVAMGPVIAVAALAFWWVWRRWGKDPARPDDIGEYWREVPDDPPAVGAALLGWRRVNGDAFAGTVMDLARRGHLRIEEVAVPRRFRKDRTTYRFVRTEPRVADPLRPFERRLVRWLFPGTTTTSTHDELLERARDDPSSSQRFWNGFRDDVRKDLDARHYLVRATGVAFVLHGAIVVVLAATAIAAMVTGAVAAGVVGLVAAVVLTPLGILHRARTPEGTRRDTKWRGLRRYLRDFSRLEEAPVGHLALWDHYLVAATALGVADELLDGLRTRFPELTESPDGLAVWYRPAAGSTSRMGLADFGRSFGASSVSALTPSSSGSGGGGGFSSGGGGGGGGGGFGAR
jgi:uncharacterized membrane protein